MTVGNSGLLTSFIGDEGAELVRSEPAEPDRFLVKIEYVSLLIFSSLPLLVKLSNDVTEGSSLSGWNNEVKSIIPKNIKKQYVFYRLE